jgi:Zn-dependent protease
MHLCRISGIPLSLHWSFLLLLAYLGWEGWDVAQWLGFTWVLSYSVAVFTCVVLHELGHALMARRFGASTIRILLLPIGGMAEFDHIPEKPKHEILIALAGPAVNLLLVVLLFAFGVRFPAGWDVLLFPLTVAELGRHLFVMNVAMGLFNLLPIFPMDGGRVFRALMATRFSYLKATFVAATLAKVLALIGIGVMLLSFASPNWMGSALFGFIFMAGELELRAVRQREIDDQHWRETWTRFEQQSTKPGGPDSVDSNPSLPSA